MRLFKCRQLLPFRNGSLKKLLLLNLTTIFLIAFTLNANAKRFSPPVNLTGKVTNEIGDPVQGASVFIAGTSNGTTTNSAGEFVINVPENQRAVLEISNVGFQTKTVEVGNKTNITVSLLKSLAGKHFDGPGIVYFLLGYMFFFGLSDGIVIWVFISEIFPNSIRSKGQSLGSFTHWFFAVIISWTFPVAINSPAIGPGNVFMFFAVMMVLQLLFSWKLMPETKGKTLEQIQKDLKIIY
jgi:hypothetical protein